MAESTQKLSNGDTVIFNDDRRSLQFNIKDLYKYRDMDSGSEVIKGQGTYVPREDDSILDWSNGFKRVSRVDPTTFVADLVSWDIPDNSDDIDDEDRLLGTGPGKTSESYRVYIDTRVTPHVLDINSRHHAYGEKAKEIIVFLGTDTDKDSGEVISQFYAQNGDYVGPEIPLDLTWNPDPNNRAQKAPVTGWTMHNLPDGQLVTVVVYNQGGSPIDQAKMLVHNTNITRHPQDGMKRVEKIEAISPYLSKVEPNTFYVPINATQAQLAMQAKVTYLDGTYSIQSVVDEDANGKFKMIGLKHWSPTIAGVPQELSLTYELTPENEFSFLQGVTANGRVETPYRIIGVPADPARSLKLFVFPYWVSDVEGYKLDYWLYDLAREVSYRVPVAAVELSETSPSFDGFNYTSTQYLDFGVRLGAIDNRYDANERHVQRVIVQLQRSGGTRASNWRVKFANSQKNWYGDGLECAVRSAGAGLSTATVSNGETTKAAWLQKVYYNADPLYDPQTENIAPEPTHFILVTKTRQVEVPVSQFATAITFVNDLKEGETIYLKWIKRMTAGTLQLGVTGLPVHNV